MTAHIEMQDAPMRCCGMILGSGITDHVSVGTRRVKALSGQWVEVPDYRVAVRADYFERLAFLIARANEEHRNCAMITLSSEQDEEAHQAARDLGFKTVHSFYNPNSGNTVHIMVYTEFGSRDSYEEEAPWE